MCLISFRQKMQAVAASRHVTGHTAGTDRRDHRAGHWAWLRGYRNSAGSGRRSRFGREGPGSWRFRAGDKIDWPDLAKCHVRSQLPRQTTSWAKKGGIGADGIKKQGCSSSPSGGVLGGGRGRGAPVRGRGPPASVQLTKAAFPCQPLSLACSDCRLDRGKAMKSSTGGLRELAGPRRTPARTLPVSVSLSETAAHPRPG